MGGNPKKKEENKGLRRPLSMRQVGRSGTNESRTVRGRRLDPSLLRQCQGLEYYESERPLHLSVTYTLIHLLTYGF